MRGFALDAKAMLEAALAAGEDEEEEEVEGKVLSAEDADAEADDDDDVADDDADADDGAPGAGKLELPIVPAYDTGSSVKSSCSSKILGYIQGKMRENTALYQKEKRARRFGVFNVEYPTIVSNKRTFSYISSEAAGTTFAGRCAKVIALILDKGLAAEKEDK